MKFGTTTITITVVIKQYDPHRNLQEVKSRFFKQHDKNFELFGPFGETNALIFIHTYHTNILAPIHVFQSPSVYLLTVDKTKQLK